MSTERPRQGGKTSDAPPSAGPNRPAGALPSGAAKPIAALAGYSTMQLATELVARMENARVWDGNNSEMLWLGTRLSWGLRDQLDIHNNRLSLRRYADLFHMFCLSVDARPRLEGATIVDVGCGGTNPGGFLFLLLALGARRGVAVDLDDIADPAMAVRALADVAAAMLIDPVRLTGSAAIPAAQVLTNLASFDLAKLNNGDVSGIDSSRLSYKQEPVNAISLADESVDIVMSNAFLEHVDNVPRTLCELARITKSGGVGIHVIDMTDHRRYGGGVHPLAFLAEPGHGMVHGSNRLRQSQFIVAFESSGFAVTDCKTLLSIDVPQELQASLSPDYRSLKTEDLRAGIVRLVVRRR